MNRAHQSLRSSHLRRLYRSRLHLLCDTDRSAYNDRQVKVKVPRQNDVSPLSRAPGYGIRSGGHDSSDGDSELIRHPTLHTIQGITITDSLGPEILRRNL